MNRSRFYISSVFTFLLVFFSATLDAAPGKVPLSIPPPPPCLIPDLTEKPAQLSHPPTHFPGAPKIAAESAILIEANSGFVLFEKNADTRRVPASTQKLLTALLVAERGNLDTPVTIHPEDTKVVPVKLYVKPGETYTRRELLKVLLVRSANDIAMTLGRDHSGSIEAFAAAMTQKAHQLGATNSQFINPHGLTDPHQFSTARDMAKIARAAYQNPEIRKMIATKEFFFTFNSGRKIQIRNTNRVLRNWDYCNGMKTGYTDAAGYCLISSGKYQDTEVISVVLKSSRSSVWRDSQNLLSWGLGLTK